MIRVLMPMLLLVAVVTSPTMAQGQRRARLPWWQRTEVRHSNHYAIRTDLPPAEARAYVGHLDFMYEEFARRLTALIPRGPEQLDVYVFTDQAEYVHTLARRWGIDATGTGGMFFVTSSGTGLAFWVGSLPPKRIHHVIQHEGFHQFAYSRFGNDLPMWVNEGLAEYFGAGVRVGNRFLLGQATPRVLEGVREAIEREEHVPFQRMLEMTNAGWLERVKAGEASLLYLQAWSMVQFLVEAEGERFRAPFVRYLRLLNNGKPRDWAFAEVFGSDIEAFDRRWRAFAASARPSPFATALERIEYLAEGALFLSRDGAVPESLDELRTALRSANFELALQRHGRRVVISANDDDNFRIPADGSSPQPPVFTVSPPPRRTASQREREQAARHPQPCAIATRFLRPRGLSIDWRRDRETGAVRYVIVAR